ncbi:MAG TPA: hypothetical protein VFE51_20620 [Verrucomicrobiae bacterium]|nr:hypothetical protein [Verrucomicrobiae bacterium]
MKRRRVIAIIVVMAFALVGGALLSHNRHQSKFEVRYGEDGDHFANRNDVITIRQIVSHERLMALWRAICRRDVRGVRDSVRQLAFGHLRLIQGSNVGVPAVEVYYDDGWNRRCWAQYELHYQNGRWTPYSYSYLDAWYYGAPLFIIDGLASASVIGKGRQSAQ